MKAIITSKNDHNSKWSLLRQPNEEMEPLFCPNKKEFERRHLFEFKVADVSGSMNSVTRLGKIYKIIKVFYHF